MDPIFQLPICYNDKVQKLSPTLVADLELVQCLEKDETPVYEHVLKPQNTPARQILGQIAEHYTTDIQFLKETQQLTKRMAADNPNDEKYFFNDFHIDETLRQWEEIKGETSFCEKYLYVDWTVAKGLNQSKTFLQWWCIYTLASPLMSLCLPIIILILPFLLIKLRGHALTVSQYTDILKTLISNHALCKVFTSWNTVDAQQKLYLLVSSAFYLFSIYQNILLCIRFFTNLKKIQEYLYQFQQYLGMTLETMQTFLDQSDKLNTYRPFTQVLCEKRRTLETIYQSLCAISLPCPFTRLTDIGHSMHTFYQLYDNAVYDEAIRYSFGFNGYFSVLCDIARKVERKRLTKTTFTKPTEKRKRRRPTVFVQMYYPTLDKATVVKNDCSLDKNMILTGPNASGKTTTMKTAIINILLSQQIGFGCFDSLKLTPYDKFHCYLNIPDTCGRDSLFQAEARRCKEVLDDIQSDNELTHFCIFDELFSGTNPEEAVSSATSFMSFLAKNKRVTCMLTTHYLRMCQKLGKHKRICNYHMDRYRVEKGISKKKGGIEVLRQMNYPLEILDLANSFH